MSFLFSSKPNAPRGVTEPFSQKELNAASNQMNIALKVIANQHVKRYAKEIENAAVKKAKGNWNAADARKLQEAEAKAKIATSNAAAAEAPASQEVKTAENAALQAVSKIAAAVNNPQISVQVNWNNKNRVWRKSNNKAAPDYHVNWNRNQGRNSKVRLVPVTVRVNNPLAEGGQ